MNPLPTLYKKTSTGAIEQWRIDVSARKGEGAIITTWGHVDGSPQQAIDIVTKGKNLGKKNETTAVQQAEAEATSQWEKKKKKGYVESIEDAQEGKVDALIEGGVFPMLAKRFDEQGHKIVYPAFVQPKFDGHRCIAVVKDGKATLWSRTRKPITGLPHIVKDIEAFVAGTRHSLYKNCILDGELYNHDYRTRFEDLSSFIRTPEPQPGCEAVQYHIYDQANCAGTQVERLVLVDSIRNAKRPYLVGVETVQVNDEDELMVAFENFLEQGYEGAMVRNADGEYVNKRSADLQKIKEFDDAEFKVVGVEEGRGKMAGHAIFVCVTENKPYPCGTTNFVPPAGVEFRAKMKGKAEVLKEFFEHPERAVGRMMTVKYQGFTNKNNKPRFPVALRFKEDI